MKGLSLPIKLSELDSIDRESSFVDMSKLNFPCDQSKQIRSSFIFIRNTNIDLNLVFDNCAYEMKSSYLMFYLKGNINVDIPIMITTWIEILLFYDNGNDNNIVLPCILDKDEILLFIRENNDFVKELNRFISSIPICTIEFYLTYSKIETDISMSEFQTSDWDELNMDNFMHMLDYDDFILLISPKDGLMPVKYNNYFSQSNNMYIGQLISKLPFLNIINIMASPGSVIEKDFIDGIESGKIFGMEEENDDR